ncbi:MAG TPA: ribosome silencing factor [Thermoanaerobaculia bacterium]|nr:ribosome silencing factor [Thermoanaerobaculia bacterium]
MARRARAKESDKAIEERVRHAAEAAVDKKAFDIEILDVARLTSIGDFFIICSTRSERQSQAVADAVEERVRQEAGAKPILVEGKTPGRWILMDYGDFVVHVFTEDCRRYYGLERLWGDAPNLTSRFVSDEQNLSGQSSE